MWNVLQRLLFSLVRGSELGLCSGRGALLLVLPARRLCLRIVSLIDVQEGERHESIPLREEISQRERERVSEIVCKRVPERVSVRERVCACVERRETRAETDRRTAKERSGVVRHGDARH